ncbi:MAG: lysophospholipid acyltransferase family protein [Deltaproteobacteria bacterium]|nr:lysophospholipid acyltransferase family protein [Deltaproteobacteria bacterium]
MKLHRTVFDTPFISTILRSISRFLLFCAKWESRGTLPNARKFVLIAAPHTSNWDLYYMLLIAFDLKASIYWMGKDAIFKKPFGHLMRWLGGVPIDRSKSNNTVEQSIELFDQSNRLILTVPPSGTRSRVSYWKTGFYHIANGASVPIVLGFLDYRLRAGGIGPLVQPTGDITKDMKVISTFYADITGKHPIQMLTALNQND